MIFEYMMPYYMAYIENEIPYNFFDKLYISVLKNPQKSHVFPICPNQSEISWSYIWGIWGHKGKYGFI